MNSFIKLFVLLVIGFLCATQNIAQSKSNPVQNQGVILSGVPPKIDKKAHYLIYLSGYIVHAGDLRPTSPKFGVYEYEKILDAFKQKGFAVISEARQQSDEIEPYAKRVAEQMRQMLKSGVPPQNITIVGASQGGWMAMLVSTYLKNRDLNYVFIGVCGADEGFLDLVDLHGSALFISEKTDRFPISMCRRFRRDATGLIDYKEIETDTGEQHGFLYRPLKEWIEPTVARAQTHLKRGAGDSFERELMRLQNEINEAENKKDFAALDRLLTEDYIFTESNGRISDRKQLYEDLKKSESSAGETINYEEVKIYPYKNSAVMSYLLVVKARDKDGKENIHRFRGTAAWVKRQKRWRMAAVHVARIRT